MKSTPIIIKTFYILRIHNAQFLRKHTGTDKEQHTHKVTALLALHVYFSCCVCQIWDSCTVNVIKNVLSLSLIFKNQDRVEIGNGLKADNRENRISAFTHHHYHRVGHNICSNN